MYGLPEQPFKLTVLTSASVIALMKATPPTVPTANVGFPFGIDEHFDHLLRASNGDVDAVGAMITNAALELAVRQ